MLGDYFNGAHDQVLIIFFCLTPRVLQHHSTIILHLSAKAPPPPRAPPEPAIAFYRRRSRPRNASFPVRGNSAAARVARVLQRVAGCSAPRPRSALGYWLSSAQPFPQPKPCRARTSPELRMRATAATITSDNPIPSRPELNQATYPSLGEAKPAIFEVSNALGQPERRFAGEPSLASRRHRGQAS